MIVRFGRRRLTWMKWVFVLLLVCLSGRVMFTAIELKFKVMKTDQWEAKISKPIKPTRSLVTLLSTDNQKAKRYVVITDKNVRTICKNIVKTHVGWHVIGIDKSKNLQRAVTPLCKVKQEELPCKKRCDKDQMRLIRQVFMQEIQNGAVGIFLNPDTSKLNSVITDEDSSILKARYTDSAIFDSLTHYGLKPDWRKPRLRNNTYSLLHTKTATVQSTPMIDLSDMGGNKLSYSRLDWDESSPPVSLEQNVYGTVELSTSTFFTTRALWAFPAIPLSRCGVVTWNFITQRLLWIIGDTMQLLAGEPRVANSKNGYTLCRSKTLPMLAKSLNEWQCSIERGFRFCANEILNYVWKRGYLDNTDRKQILDWFQQLKNIGYGFPKPLKESGVRKTFTDYVNFRPQNPGLPSVPKSLRNVKSDHSKHALYKSVYQNNTLYEKFKNILLVVEFHGDYYENIPFVEYLYRPMFKNIIYCGKESGKIARLYFRYFLSYELGSKGHQAAAFFYACAALVMKMQFHVDGYLMTSDDVVMNPGKLYEMDQNKVLHVMSRGHISPMKFDIFTHGLCNKTACESKGGWIWPERYRKELKNVYYRLQAKMEQPKLYETCINRLHKYSGRKAVFIGVVSDVYYLPQKWANDFAVLALMFREEELYMEIAIPTLIHCIAETNDIKHALGLQLTPNSVQRNQPWLSWKLFTQRFFYIHPTKWGYIRKNHKKYTDFFLNDVIPFYLNSISNPGKIPR